MKNKFMIGLVSACVGLFSLNALSQDYTECVSKCTSGCLSNNAEIKKIHWVNNSFPASEGKIEGNTIEETCLKILPLSSKYSIAGYQDRIYTGYAMGANNSDEGNTNVARCFMKAVSKNHLSAYQIFKVNAK